MNCFLFYSILFYLSYVLATEFDLICPTPRRLLLGNRVPSGSVDEKKSSPPKYARSGLHDASSSAYIRPKTSHEHKERTSSHLLKSKEKKSHEPHRSKSSSSKKKKQSQKKINITGSASTAVKTRGLVAVKPNELERCRALLHIDSIPTATPSPPTVKVEKTKIESPKKVKETNEKKPKEKTPNKKNKEAKVEQPSTPAPTTTAAPPPVVKTKREKATPPPPVVVAEEDEILPSDDLFSASNHSMVDRAIHFVKNIFQLSDDILEIPIAPKSSPSIPSHPDQNDADDNIHRSRKLLSIAEDHFQAVRFSSRRLLAAKTPEKKSVAKKSKSKATTTAEQTKPKVGWAYRYRISRYLAAQKMPRTQKKTLESKVNKKKSHRQSRQTSIDATLHHDLTLTERSPPQRPSSHSKSKDESTTEHRSHLKSFDHLTDPAAIVRAYEEHGYKPRVGWRYRYRVSAYIEALREQIRHERTRKKTKDVDHSKKEHKELGIPFDRETSTQIRRSKSSKKTKKSATPERSSAASFFAPLVKNTFCLLSSAACPNDSSSTKKKSLKKLRTRKENRAKQFIRSRATKFGAEDKYTERRIDERMQELYQNPSLPPPQSPPAISSKTKTTTPMPRLRTISEVIREEADTFFMNKPSDFRSSEELQEEGNEAIAERRKVVRNRSRTAELVTDQSEFKIRPNKN